MVEREFAEVLLEALDWSLEALKSEVNPTLSRAARERLELVRERVEADLKRPSDDPKRALRQMAEPAAVEAMLTVKRYADLAEQRVEAIRGFLDLWQHALAVIDSEDASKRARGRAGGKKRTRGSAGQS